MSQERPPQPPPGSARHRPPPPPVGQPTAPRADRPIAGRPAIDRDRLAHYRQQLEQLPGWRRIGEILIDLGFATAAQVDEGLATQARRASEGRPPTGLLEILEEAGAITPFQAQQALNYQIASVYLPALMQAMADRDQALEELRTAYRASLSTVAAYAESAARDQARLAELSARVTELTTDFMRVKHRLAKYEAV